MIPVRHIWVSDLDAHVIPPRLAEATKFRKDGWPDQRCRVSNRPFLLWLEGIEPRYTLTPAGRAHLEGKS